MNFYVQAYKKGKDTKTVAVPTTNSCAAELQQKQRQKSYEMNNNNSQDVLPILSEKKVN